VLFFIYAVLCWNDEDVTESVTSDVLNREKIAKEGLISLFIRAYFLTCSFGFFSSGGLNGGGHTLETAIQQFPKGL